MSDVEQRSGIEEHECDCGDECPGRDGGEVGRECRCTGDLAMAVVRMPEITSENWGDHIQDDPTHLPSANPDEHMREYLSYNGEEE